MYKRQLLKSAESTVAIEPIALYSIKIFISIHTSEYLSLIHIYLETKVDEAGNVLIKKPATPGKENLQTVVLQSHIDMVCEKNNDVQHDFLTDPIETEIDGEWLKAKGTTLRSEEHTSELQSQR